MIFFPCHPPTRLMVEQMNQQHGLLRDARLRLEQGRWVTEESATPLITVMVMQQAGKTALCIMRSVNKTHSLCRVPNKQ